MLAECHEGIMRHVKQIQNCGTLTKRCGTHRVFKDTKKPRNSLSYGVFDSGGRSRNRTGVGGFAIHCITILLFGLNTPDAIKPHQTDKNLSGYSRQERAISLKTLKFFTPRCIRWAQLCTHLPRLTTPGFQKNFAGRATLRLFSPRQHNEPKPAPTRLIGKPVMPTEQPALPLVHPLCRPWISKENHHD
jgi:hypothetical protein